MSWSPGLALGDLDGVVQAGQAHALLHQLFEFVHVLHGRMSAAAVGEDDDRGGAVQNAGVLRPAVLDDDRLDRQLALVEALGQQHAAGVVLVAGVAVAGAAGDEDDLLLAGGLGLGGHGQRRFDGHDRRGRRGRGVGFGHLLDADVAEKDLHRRPGVELQGDDAVRARDLVFIGQFAHQVPVDRLRDLVPFGDDAILVPVLLLDELGQLLAVGELLGLRLAVGTDDRLRAALGEDAAEAFAVDDAREVVVAVHVGLVAVDAPLFAFPTADLHARVVVHELPLDLQFEVGRLAAAPDQEGVALRRIVLGRFADDRAVFDAPELGIAVPAFERLAVEDRLEAFVGGRGRREARPQRQRQHGDERQGQEPGETFHGRILLNVGGMKVRQERSTWGNCPRGKPPLFYHARQVAVKQPGEPV